MDENSYKKLSQVKVGIEAYRSALREYLGQGFPISDRNAHGVYAALFVLRPDEDDLWRSLQMASLLGIEFPFEENDGAKQQTA